MTGPPGARLTPLAVAGSREQGWAPPVRVDVLYRTTRNNDGESKMIGTNDVERIEGATAYDRSGDKIGKVGRLYVDDESGEPSWITVSTGMFGMSESFVPLTGADFDGDDIRLAYEKDQVKNAPRIDDDQHLDPAEEEALYRHYGLSGGVGYSDAGQIDPGQAAAEPTATGRATQDVSDQTPRVDPDVDRARDTEQAMTLAEERVVAGKETVEAGRARLRKYTTTHTETVDVPVTKEKLVVERTPVSGDATSAPITDAGEQVEEITLREERPVVGTQTVAVEEVRVGKETVVDTEQVSAEVRKEHADVDVDDGVSTGTDSAEDQQGRHER